MFGGGGRPGAPAAPGLPFGGIPPELQRGVDALLADEPDHGEPDVRFSQRPTAKEQRRLSLWTLLLEYPGMLVRSAVLVVTMSVALQAGPKLTQYAIDDGMVPGHHDLGLVLAIAAAYLGFVGFTSLAQRSLVRVTGPSSRTCRRSVSQ